MTVNKFKYFVSFIIDNEKHGNVTFEFANEINESILNWVKGIVADKQNELGFNASAASVIILNFQRISND